MNVQQRVSQLTHRIQGAFQFVLLNLLPQSIIAADLSAIGRWNSPVDWKSTAIHMALLRGNNDSTFVAYWGEPGDTVRLWRYRPWEDLSGSVVSTRITSHPAGGDNIFCAGHSTLGDGRLLVGGGHYAFNVGLEHANILDARLGAVVAPRPASMAYGRWYPTLTTLPDGQVLSTAGSRYRTMVVFGGKDTNAVIRNDTRPLGLWKNGVWKDSTVLHSPPTRRYGHSASYSRGYIAMVVFGGIDASGALKSDSWILYRGDNDLGEPWIWFPMNTQGTPPSARAHHTAVFDGGGHNMYVHGGLGAGGTALGDVWKLNVDTSPAVWTEIVATNASSGPAPRSEHGVVLDEVRSRLLVWGGKLESGTWSDTLWALSLDASPTWTVVTTTGTPPAPRFGHSLLYDKKEVTRTTSNPVYKANRVMLYGGEDASGQLRGDVWLLWLPKTTGTFAWEAISPDADPTAGTPSARRDPACVLDIDLDHDPDRMLVHGGRDSGGPRSDLWSLDLDYSPSVNMRWTRMSPDSIIPTGREGHSAVNFEAFIHARIPERFNPSANTWTPLLSASKLTPMYPFMFVLPSGNLLYAGPHTATNLSYLLNTSSWTWSSSTFSSSVLGGSAVMYRPGKVLMCGGREGAVPPTLFARRIEFDSADQSSGWTTAGAMYQARTEQNLTMLPTGKVLVTGGLSVRTDSTTAVWWPQMWSPNAPTQWEDTLAREPVYRDYHSTALLLPDGRILSAGGNGTAYRRTATIFYPPYLFDGNTLPTRDPITGSPARVKYGTTFTVCTAEASTIASACLIRPGAVTHAFDHNQRYVPLSISKATSPARLLLTSPANGKVAPPGDYLLFIVDSTSAGGKSIPSFGKWITVGGVAGRDTCDVVVPAKPNGLASSIPCNDGGTVDLSWEAPADDGILDASGAADSYQLRYSTSAPGSDTLAWFNSATAYPAPEPAGVGTVQSTPVGGLTPNITHYFGLRAVDDNLGVGPLAIKAAKPKYIDCGAAQDEQERRDGMPTRFALHGVEPNPIHGSPVLRFDLPIAADVRLEVLDALGRRVRILVSDRLEAGAHQRVWDRRMDSGERVRAGMYFYSLRSPGFAAEKRVVVLGD